jgi:hypothetical protein
MTGPALPSEMPAWSAFTPLGIPGGRFPLGLEAVGGRMVAANLFPSITNATRHPRYFSFLAWAYEIFEQQWGTKFATDKIAGAQRKWRRQLEDAICMCTLFKTPEMTNIIGAREAQKLAGLPKGRMVRFRKKGPSAMDPANYGAAFGDLGLGRKVNGRVFLNPLGRELAAAFRTTVEADMDRAEQGALRRLCSGAKEIPAGALMTLADRFRIRSIGSKEPEHPILMDLLFGIAQERVRDPFREHDTLTRAGGLGFLLELVDQGAEQISGVGDFFPLFARGAFSDARPVSVAPPWTAQFGVWERFMERHFQKTSIYGIWHEVLATIRSAQPLPVPAAAIVGSLQLSARSRGMLGNAGADVMDWPVWRAIEAAARRLPSDRKELGDRFLDFDDRISDEHKTVGGDRLALSLELLLQVILDWEGRSQTLPPQQRFLHEHGGIDRLGLPWMARQVRSMSKGTVSDLLQWLIEWCVLAQSQRIAIEKLNDGDRFFIRREDDGYVVVRDQRPNQYFQYDSNRLSGAVGVLAGLRLIKKGDGFLLTAAGKAVRDQVAARG